VEFPGNHAGFVSQAEEYAKKLQEVLDNSPGQ
jgi:hypothetical protein